MTALIIGIVLVVGGVAFAAAPFLRRGSSTGKDSLPREPAAALPREPAAALPATLAAELEEMDLDLAMGKLSEEDYRALRARLERRAARRVTSLPAAGGGGGAPAAEVLEPSPAPSDDASSDLDAMAERLVREERQRVVSCGTCGPRPEPGARFCSHCGRALGGCPSCGHELRVAGARFCDHCGAALASP